jgi:uncharacterized iron-regulated membrane protein
MFRKILFWTHLAAGVAAGLVILIMSVTGVLLTYEKQIVSYVDRRAAAPGMAAAAGRGSAPLGVEELLARVRSASGAVPSSVTLRADPSEPVTVALGRESVLVDPATGEVLAPQPAGVRRFFRTVTEWHRWLGAAGEARARARAITGAANLAFLVLVVSGLYLWFPRKWAWPNLRAVLWFRSGLSGRARDFNWHNVAGFWACVPLFFIVASGVVISYPWASNWVYTLNGVAPPASGKGKGKEFAGQGKSAGPPRASWANLDPLVARARRHDPNWRSMSFQLPATDQAPVTFNIDAGHGGQPQKRSTLTLDRATAAVLRAESFADQDAGRRARSWVRFVHTGEYYGLWGQTVAGLASAAGALLVWTGIALAYRRFLAWLARDRRRAASTSPGSDRAVACGPR